MAIDDVIDQWSTTYRRLIKAMFTNINGSVVLDGPASPVEPFPATRPDDWGEWLQSLAFFVGLNIDVQVTDAAFSSAADFMTAANNVAATVQLPAPTHVQVTDLLSQLDVVNRAIREDGRFHTALQIGAALADEIDKKLQKSAT